MLPSVVLLNPPGSRPWLRDGYCSLEGRRSTRFHPMDLLVQSGLLRDQARITVVEAIGADLDGPAALRAVTAARPDLVLSLVGSTSAGEDAAFLGRIRDALPDTRIVISGDLPQFEADGLDRFPAADAALLDFTAPDLLATLDGGGSATWHRGTPRPARARQGGRFRYGLPDYAAFPERNYRLPYRPGRIGSPLASFGCPFPCRFCNTSQVSWKVREVDDLLAELRWLGERCVRHAYIRDATFGVDRAHRDAVLDGLLALPRPLTWNTFTRIDLHGQQDLQRMARAGCRVLQLGLELPEAERLRALHKPLHADRVARAIGWAHEAGIAVCGHFLLGVPGLSVGEPSMAGDADRDARQDAERVLRYALSLGCDYASFNVAAPRPGAPFRAAGGFLSPARAATLQATTMRGFYTHPRTVLRQLQRLRRPAEAVHIARQALALFSPRASSR